jgi:hypothetical protein
MAADLKVWMTNHSHPLIISGAFLVFLTFVVKEGLHDYWQRTSESIETAHYIYDIRIDERTLVERSGKFDDNPALIEPDNPSWPMDRLKEVYQVGKEQVNDLGRIQSDMRYLTILDSSLPKWLSSAREIKEVLDKASAISDRLEASRKKLYRFGFDDLDSMVAAGRAALAPTPENIAAEQSVTAKREAAKTEAMDAAEKEEDEDDSSIAELTTKSKALVDKVWKDANEIHDNYDRYSVCAWWISAFLFAFGWGLGLIGKLYGVPEAAGGE